MVHIYIYMHCLVRKYRAFLYFTADKTLPLIMRRDPSVLDIMKWLNDEKKTKAGDKQNKQWDSEVCQ